MGTHMAPCYANIFIGWFKNQFVYTFPQQPLIWCRYIDDIFLIWTRGMDNLQEFISHLNTCHPTIKFTSEISETHVPFLDILVSKNENHINTDLYCIPTDTHNYLLYTSCHCGRAKMLYHNLNSSDLDEFATMSLHSSREHNKCRHTSLEGDMTTTISTHP